MTSEVETAATAVRSFEELYIGGEWVAPAEGGTVEVVSPATEEVIGYVPLAGVEDARRAVRAARASFDDGRWRRMPPMKRAEVVAAIGEGISRRVEELARTFTAESGQPLSASRANHARTASYWTRAADLATYFPFEEVRAWPTNNGRATLIHEAAGVAVTIHPSNGPISTAGNKVAPALVAGCSIVMKPAIDDPICTMILAEVIAETPGLPPGVVNVIPGGREVGDFLVSCPDVDTISFTGSTAVGKSIMRAAADNVTRTTMELGGKSAAIVTDDVDLEAIASDLMWGGIRSNGQICFATTRILVSRANHDRLISLLDERMGSIVVGDPMSPATEQGPMLTAAGREKVERLVAKTISEGDAELIRGGRRPADLERGWYYEPTLFSARTNRATVACEELFGPVLTVVPYTDIDEAVAMANDSAYGLGGSVWCRDVDRAQQIARRVRTGHLYINANGAYTGQAFGGFKQSGIGREGGPEGLMEFLETRVIFD